MIRNSTLRRATTLLIVVAVCIVLDQGTKALAQTYLPPRTLHLLGDTVRLHLSENAGAFLSLGAALPPHVRFQIFTVASAGLLVGVAAYAIATPGVPPDVLVALACITGGGIGNLIDRVTRDGHVVDFLNFGIGSLRTGILNVADIFVTFGAIYVMIAAFRHPEESEPASERAGESANKQIGD